MNSAVAQFVSIRGRQKKIFEIIGLSDQEVRKRFGFLLKAFDYGATQHAGVAFGIDRLTRDSLRT